MKYPKKEYTMCFDAFPIDCLFGIRVDELIVLYEIAIYGILL